MLKQDPDHTIKRVRIATRKSPLALWQANHVAEALQVLCPKLSISLVQLTSQGDQLLDVPLAKVGGKGLFVKELERALIADEADIAVHSMKDVPMVLPEGLSLPVICQRDDPRDAFVSNTYRSLQDLPVGAVVGTSSLRRQCQLLEKRPDLIVTFLRGNVNTRLAKLDKGQYDAIILAAVGLKRLGYSSRISSYLSIEQSLPAAGQGAIGIEVCNDNKNMKNLIQPLHDKTTALCVHAEKEVSRYLNGSCQVPLASFATLHENNLYLKGLVGTPDATTMLRSEIKGDKSDPLAVGQKVAEHLLSQGAASILSEAGKQ